MHILYGGLLGVKSEDILLLFLGQVFLFGICCPFFELLIIAHDCADNFIGIFGGLQLVNLLCLQFLRHFECIYFLIITIKH